MLDLSIFANYWVPWLVFGLFHTLLASLQVRRVLNKIGLTDQQHRLAFNVFAGVSLPMVLLFVPIPTVAVIGLLDKPLFQIIIVVSIFILAGVIAVLGLSAWNLREFAGLSAESSSLQTNGIYAFARHPVYTAALVGLVGLTVAEFSELTLAWLLGMGGYFVVGSIPEEWKLARVFPQYNNYKRHVGRFFPSHPHHWRYLWSTLNNSESNQVSE